MCNLVGPYITVWTKRTHTLTLRKHHHIHRSTKWLCIGFLMNNTYHTVAVFEVSPHTHRCTHTHHLSQYQQRLKGKVKEVWENERKTLNGFKISMIPTPGKCVSEVWSHNSAESLQSDILKTYYRHAMDTLKGFTGHRLRLSTASQSTF